jgi:hypothetical protein
MEQKQFIHDLQTQDFYDAYNKFIFSNDSKVFNKLASKFFFLELTRKVPGEIVELGVFKGSGIAGWLKVCRSIQSTRRVIGFDFFNQEALVESIKTSDANMMNSLFADRNFDPSGYGATLMGMLNQMNFQNFDLIEGDVFETIPKYLAEIEAGADCVFGSRFIAGASLEGYPQSKYHINRVVNLAIQILFFHGLNDTTGAFKCYSRNALDAMQPLVSDKFNITVEMPLKAIDRKSTRLNSSH